MKFGGTSVANLDRIRRAAKRVGAEVAKGYDVIVIVSAMSGKTNELVGWVGETSPLYDAREYDAVVSSGENVTAGLMALTLQEMDVPARSWQGWQVPLKTNSAHSQARIEDIGTDNINAKFGEGMKVAVVAGFQGISPEGRITEEPDTPDAAPAAEDSPSLLGRLLGWSSNGTPDEEGALTGPEALGPAFRNSAPAELSMVSNILRLRELRVEDVMTPRVDIVAVAEDAPLEEVITAFEEGSFSRLPVFRETLDDPRGFVHLKDLALNYGFGNGQDSSDFKVADHVRKAIFVPPSMRIAALLQKMQHDRVHMALVIDEFGGVDGLITIEDLVEQIVGDIEDEHDQTDADPWVDEGNGAWLIQARADIDAFQTASGLNLLTEDWEEDVDTLGGLVFMLANRVPTRGEVIPRPREARAVTAERRPRPCRSGAPPAGSAHPSPECRDRVKGC